MNWKLILSVAGGIVTIGAAITMLSGGVEALDEAITTEHEHSKDIVVLLEQLAVQNDRIEQAIEFENEREKIDRIQRNNREIMRLRKYYRNEVDPVERENIQMDIQIYLDQNKCIEDGTC